MTIDTFRKVNKLFNNRIDNATDEEREKIKEHLNMFYDDTSSEDNKCIFNEERPILSWGLSHGNMFDSNTGLSWKAYHYLTTDGVESRYERIMQYHPDVYDIDE